MFPSAMWEQQDPPCRGSRNKKCLFLLGFGLGFGLGFEARILMSAKWGLVLVQTLHSLGKWFNLSLSLLDCL